MTPRFGTSGLRGLASDLATDLVADHTRAFLASCPIGGGLFVGQDLRASSPRIAAAVMDAATGQGVEVADVGTLPVPALALAAQSRGWAAIMVTGSHIPADRNGLKFYTPSGEITKNDEAAILAARGLPSKGMAAGRQRDSTVLAAYESRYLRAFGGQALQGLRVGIWQHSSAGRDLITDVVARLGARIVTLGRSDSFVAVDTEAIDAATETQLARWVAEHGLDALVSADGDGDRPLLVDETGRIVPGDLLGLVTSEFLGASHVVTPISSNTAVELCGLFDVRYTRIGSPHVIAGLNEVAAAISGARVAGYEPNGGFLLGFEAAAPRGALAPLVTRDSLLPMLSMLAMAREQRRSVGELVARLPPRFTARGRLENVPQERAQSFLDKIRQEPAPFLSAMTLGYESARNEIDGLRLMTAGGEIVHLRPSGNAPEFRLYVEAETASRAKDLLQRGLLAVRVALWG